MFCNFFKIFFITLFVSFKCVYAFDLVNIDKAKVVSVADGDTITVSKNNQMYKIRLLGIQAPEVFKTPIEPYGMEAKLFLNSLVYGKEVDIKYVKDNKQDKYSRILGMVYLNNENINLAMIKNGYAFVYIVGKVSKIPDLEKFIAEENKAIDAKINIWSHDNYKVIKPKDAINYIGHYKIIDAHIYGMSVSKSGYWLYLGNKKDNSLSIRIPHNVLSANNLNIENYKDKDIRIRGFIDRYSSEYSPMVNLFFKDTIRIK